jgi:transposase-like protein
MIAASGGMPILWGKATLTTLQTRCPFCQSPRVEETDRDELEISFRCVNCHWTFVMRAKVTTH